jgi:hypothetical protein
LVLLTTRIVVGVGSRLLRVVVGEKSRVGGGGDVVTGDSVMTYTKLNNQAALPSTSAWSRNNAE